MNTHTQYLLVPDRTQSILACVGPATDKPGAFTPFGYRRSGKVSAAWNGQVAESLSEHYLLGNGHRAYHPVLGRFSCPDALSPFGQGGLNTYAYCKGDPINATDPSGRISSAWLYGITAVIVGAGGGAAGWLWSEGNEIGGVLLMAGSLMVGSAAIGFIKGRSVQRAGVQQVRQFDQIVQTRQAYLAQLSQQAHVERIAASQLVNHRSAAAALNTQEGVAPFHRGAGQGLPPTYEEAILLSQRVLPHSPDQSSPIRRIRR